MKFNSIIIRYGEIALKGKNRPEFERKLISNITHFFNQNNIKFSSIKRIYGRILIKTNEKCDFLKYVFGITSFSYALELDVNEVREEALKLYEKGTFKISTQRIDKKIGLSSQKMNEDIGAYIALTKKAKVNLKNPDTDIGIELMNNKAYLFNEKIDGAGGLPVGINGRVAILVEDESAIKAALLVMKRGCDIVLIENRKLNYDKLRRYNPKFEIRNDFPKNIKAIVVSDTLNNLKERDYDKLVLRPLIYTI